MIANLLRLCLGVAALAILALVLGSSVNGSDDVVPTSVEVVTLDGTLGSDHFLVAVDPTDSSRLKLCSDTCFTRARSEVQSVVITGYDGDDTLTIGHGPGLVTNQPATGTANLPVSFDAGPGSDRVMICPSDPGLATCDQSLTTTVSPGASADERVVEQVDGTGQSFTLTTDDVATISDGAPGTTTVAGTPDADDLGYDETPDGLGRITLNADESYTFDHKTSVSIDGGSGADQVTLTKVAGLADTTSSCAAGTSAPVCVAADTTGDDSVHLAAAGTDSDQVSVATTGPESSEVTGLVATGPVHLSGIDDIGLSLQSDSDSLAVATTPAADHLYATAGANDVKLSGDLATDSDTAQSLPAIAATGDGTAPLDVSLDTRGGADALTLTTTTGDDDVSIGPSDQGSGGDFPDLGCTTPLASCAVVTPDGDAGERFTLAGLESRLVMAQSGADTLHVLVGQAPTTTWRGGEGSDSITVLGTGSPLTADLLTHTISQAGSTGDIVATDTEDWTLDAAGSSVTTRGTAAGDQLDFRPEGASSGTITGVPDPAAVHLRGVGGSNVIDPAGGDDTVTVTGTSDADKFAVGRTDSTLGVAVGTLLPVRVSGTEAAVLAGAAGDDRFDITGAGGPPTLTADGGSDAGADEVTFAAATTDTTVGMDQLGSGRLDSDGPPIGLQNVERIDVEGDAAHSLTVRGSDAADTLTQHENTVTIGRTADVTFSRFPTLVLDGGPAADQLWTSPGTTTGVDEVKVAGGTESDALTVLGSPLSETLTYTPTDVDSGTVRVGAAPPVAFEGIENAALHGETDPPSGDTLVVDTPYDAGTLSLEPGALFDGGTVHFRNLEGTSTTAAPLQFGGLGTGEVRFATDPGGPADRVVVQGEADDDVITLANRAAEDGAEGVVTVDKRIPVSVPGARTLVLDGLAGVDTFRLPTDHPIPGDNGPGVEVRAGGPDTGDHLVLTAGTGDLVADLAADTVAQSGYAAVANDGVEHIDLDAQGNDTRVTGGSGPDALTWRPTGQHDGELTAPGSPVLAMSSLGGLTVDPGAGADTVTTQLRSVADDATVVRGETTKVEVAGLQTVLIPLSDESLTLATGDAADHVLVTGAGGPATLAVDGGGPTASGDVLQVATSDATVAYATDPTSGRMDTPGGAVRFAAIENLDLAGTGTGSLTVAGTDGAETFTIGDASSPRIRVDEAAVVTYAGYPDVSLQAAGGDDDVTVGYTALGDIDTLHVDGGPGNSDQVSVDDTTGTTRTFTFEPTTGTTGSVTATGERTAVHLAGTEAVELDGRGGNDTVVTTTPSGAQSVDVTPGSVADAGTVGVGSLMPMTFRQLGSEGRAVVGDADGSRVDTLTLEGSSAADSTVVDGPDDEVRRAGWVPLGTPSTTDLLLPGYDGDDDVTGIGPLPYATTTVDGAGPDNGDSLSLRGVAAPSVTVDLAAHEVVGYGGTVRFPGVARLDTDGGGRPLTEIGTDRDDAFCYDPMAPRDGRLFLLGAPGGGTATSTCSPDLRGANVLHTFVEVSDLTVDPAGGADEVIVDGTTDRDLVNVQEQAPLTMVTVHPNPDSGTTARLPVQVTSATTESVVVAADSGPDSFDVTTYDSAPTPLVTVLGEGPSTSKLSDDLVVRDGTGEAHMHETKSHTKGSGTVTAEYTKGSGAVVRVDYVDVELVKLVRDPHAD